MANQPANQSAAKALTDTTAALRGVVSALQPIASMGGTPAGAIAAVGGQLSKLSAGMGPLAAAAGGFAGVASALPQLFKSAADSVASYVAAFSPATAARYSQAWNDLSASIGEQLLPVLQMATGVVRFFADTVASLTPIIKPVVDQLSRIYSAFGGALQDVFNELIKSFLILDSVFAPFRELMIDLATGPLQLMTWGLKQLAEWLKTVTADLALLFGVEVPKIEGSSYGKAATSVSTTTTDALLRSLREKAFALGKSGGEEDQQKRTANLLQQLWEWLVNELPAILMGESAAIVAGVSAAIIELVRQGSESATRGVVGGADLAFQAMTALQNLRSVVPGVPAFAGP